MSNSPNREYVCGVLRERGVEATIPHARFARQVRKSFGQTGKRMLEGMSRIAGGEKLDLYGLKNSSLELSLCVTSQLFQHVPAAFLEWMVSLPGVARAGSETRALNEDAARTTRTRPAPAARSRPRGRESPSAVTYLSVRGSVEARHEPRDPLPSLR